jgi:RHS repeat-associated protein
MLSSRRQIGLLAAVPLVMALWLVAQGPSSATAAEINCHMEGRLYWENESLSGGTPPYFTEFERGAKPFVEFQNRTPLRVHRDHYAICTRLGHVIESVVECKASGEAKCGEVWRAEVPGTHPLYTHVWIGANYEITYYPGEGGQYELYPWTMCSLSCGEEVKFYSLLGDRSRKHGRRRRERLGEHNPADPNLSEPCEGDPVDCATGNLTESQTDMSVGGRGVPLTLTRSYNSQTTIEEASPGPFGFGWSSSFSDHLEINKTQKVVTVVQANGSTVVFEGDPETVGELKAPRWAQATLSHLSNGSFIYTFPDQQAFIFDGEGRLSSEADRNGNTTSLTYDASHRLETVTDSSGRKLTLAYNSSGQVESATDPMGHTVKYGYEGGDLTSVTEPGESSPRWRFKYESHRMTEMTDGRGNTTKNEYTANRVTKQTDPLGHVTSFAYEQPSGEFLDGAGSVAEETIEDEQEPEMSSGTEETEYVSAVKANGGTIPASPEFVTRTTNEATGAVTQERFDSEGQLTAITRGYGTSGATTQSFSYDAAGNLLSLTDGNGHKTRYEYDSAGNRTKMIDANEHETKWTYNSTHDVETITTPKGETTTMKRDSHGNAESVSRPAPKETAQITKYTYDSHGDVESMTDALGRVWKYEYDSYGDRTGAIDPEGDKRTWTYNKDSQETAMVSPRGNVTGGEPAKFTTTTERDAQGRPLTVIEPGPYTEGTPTNKTKPSISGVVQKGQTLFAGPGIWEGAPSFTYTYQWQRCNAFGESCLNVSGATNPTYMLSGGDAGHAMRVMVTATNVAGSASSTSEATVVVSSPVPVYNSQFGSFGSGNGQLREPEGGLVADALGNVWVSDTENSRLEEFNSKGEFVRIAGSSGEGSGQFKTTYGVTVDSSGNVWATDEGNSRVEEFTGGGAFVKMFGWGVSNGESKFEICTSSCRAGLHGSGNGEFYVPEGIAVDSKGNIFVADRGNKRVQELNSEDAFVRSITKPEEKEGPFYLGLDSSGNLWVAYSWDNKIGEFDSEGKLIRTWGTAGSEEGKLNDPYGVAVGPEGNVWVSEYGNNRVQVFTPTGEYLYKFGSKGNGPGQFNDSPHGLAFYGSNVYVLDSGVWWENTGNSRIEKWVLGSAPSNTTPSSISGELIIGQTLSAGAGTWSASPAPTYTYQWQDCNASGESCSNVPGATNSTYLLSGSDAGHTLRVVVTATNLADSTASTSAATEIPTEPRATKYAYDANGNIESVTDPNANRTSYTYNADNEPIKVTEPNGTITETGYDGAGHVTSQTDGNKHETKYVRNVLGQVTEVSDPIGHKTTKEYDLAGNLKTLTDPQGRTTTYTYDPANRLIEAKYSDGKTPTVKYEYDEDGERTVMTDGTGTTKYTYDQLDRLTETKNGHGDTIKQEYDLAGEQTKITYPNGKTVTNSYDKDGRLEKVTDWLEHTTQFAYDPDSNLATTTFPTGTNNVDKYSYNTADQMSEVKMTNGSETLASLLYSRNGDGQVTKTISKGLPGAESTENAYDTNSRLTKTGSTAYEYDAANNPTKLGSATYKYNTANQLETGPSLTYAYDELGERTKTIPSTGPATTYGYDQAGNLTSVSRPEEGATPKIEDTYTYNGEGLRTSQTISATTSYLAWDMSKGLPLIVNDETNSYIYGPGGLAIEEINNSTGAVLYLHHDQQGSIRLLTGSTGTVTGSTTFDAYGNQVGHTGTTTSPLGYDGQYMNSDTGLIYLRARSYDPGTAQFISVDPLAGMTRLSYAYAADNPINLDDPTGLIFGIPGTPSWSDLGTRFVGFWDGFTRPVLGGTGALRGWLGLNGGLDTCSTEYEVASKVGELDVSVEAGAVAGGGTEVILDRLLENLPRLGPVLSPLAAGTLGGVAQHAVTGESITPTTAGQGAVGGLAGELATGFVPGTSAAGTAGAVNAALGLLW